MKFICLVLFSLISILLSGRNVTTDKTVDAKEWLKNQPLSFVENKGQFTDSEGKPAKDVLFKASSGNLDIYITTNGLSYVFNKYEEKQEEKTVSGLKDGFPGKIEKENRKVSCYRMDMNLKDASISKEQILKELPGKQGVTNYFYPNCPDGIYGVQEFGKITIKNIYKGIDWVIYTNSASKGQPLKYDFVVQPQADYKDIKMKFVNAQSTTLTDNDTKLKIKTIAGTIEEGGLYSYMKSSNEKQSVTTSYTIDKNSLVQFKIGQYDKTKPLVIDPLVWATYYGGKMDDHCFSICTDSHDNIYVTGISNSADFPLQQITGAYWQSGPPVYSDIYVIKFNNQGKREWATFYGAEGNTYNSLIAVDSQDNIYLTGSTYSRNFPTQGIPGSFLQTEQAGMLDIYIIKFNSQSMRQWATYYGATGDEIAYSIGIDKQDHIYITGSTRSNTFPVSELVGAYNQSHSGGERDVIILRFNSQGQRQWATYYGGNLDEYSTSIAFDNLDNLYIAGLSSSKDFPVQYLASAYNQRDLAGDANAFILKFNVTGIRQWATFYGGNSMDFGNSICTDQLDNVYITGKTRSSDFPTQTLAGAYNHPTQIGIFDSFIVKFNFSGQRLWATTFGGNDEDESVSICADHLNNIYILGQTLSNDFPTQPFNSEYWQPQKTGYQDWYLLMFNDEGKMEWATYYGSENYGFANDITVDRKNSIFAVGMFIGSKAYTIDYGNNAYFDDSWNGQSDAFLLKINTCYIKKPTSIQTDRNEICIKDTDSITLTAIGGVGDTLKWYSDKEGLYYLGKNTPFKVPIPQKITTYYARWESSCDTSACGSIVINVYSEIKTTKNPIICQGETYSVGLSNYTTSGFYTDYLKTVSGCDSIITTNLTVNPVKRFTQDPIICQGGIVIVGIHSYTTSGIYTDILQAVSGCDSIITTNLTVNPVQHTILSPEICDGDIFTVGNSVYKTTGLFTDVLKTYMGCDSTITTNLIVNSIKRTNLVKDICPGETFLVGIHSYTSTGIYSDTLSSVTGCDSIITANLKVNSIEKREINPAICDGEVFVVGSHSYQTPGNYTDLLKTVFGCDSLVTTHLTVNQIKYSSQQPSICHGDIYTVGAHKYTTQGIFTDILKAVSGCDSIVTTDLSVNPIPFISLGNDQLLCPGDSIILYPGTGFPRYEWSDGSKLSSLKVTLPGDYSVTVYNKWCPATDAITISECGSELWFPNAFSPNNDNKNESFKPVILGTLISYQIKIYNRWGQQIYSSTDAFTGWDGNSGGIACPNGLYVYAVSYSIGREPSIKQSIKRGAVTLLR